MEIQIIVLFALIISIGLLSAGLIMTAIKFGIIDWYELNRKTWMPEFCVFCLGFWLSVGMIALLFISGFPMEWIYFFTPFASAALSRIALENIA